MLNILARRLLRAMPHVRHTLASIIAEGVLEAESDADAPPEERPAAALRFTIEAIEAVSGRDLIDDDRVMAAVAAAQEALRELYAAIRNTESR